MNIHVVHEPGSVAVWLDPDEDLHQGLCIGVGQTFEAAKADAVGGLRDALDYLNAIAADEVSNWPSTKVSA